MASLMDRLKASYDVLKTGQASSDLFVDPSQHIASTQPSSVASRVTYDNTKTVLAPIVTRIAIDCAAIPLKHVRIDRDSGRYEETIHSELNDRLNLQANRDQSGAAFIHDAITTMLVEGAVALVPVETSQNPMTGSYEILSVRVGSIVEWFNGSVRVSVYNEAIGERSEITLPKGFVAIAYNPLYAVMNEPNSTLRRLVDRLALLDQADGRQFSPQLDLLIQLPYTLKNERRQNEAERRLEVIEEQLNDSKYGIAYLDATEKVTQLNRPVTNTLFETVSALTESLHAQLGLTPTIFSGTASPEEILLYNNRTILPISKALTDAMRIAFLTRTAISQGQSIMAFPNLFKMAPISEFAEAADKLTRNAIMSSNEIRAEVGLSPSKDKDADALRNKNLNLSDNEKQESVEKDKKKDEMPDSKEKQDEVNNE